MGNCPQAHPMGTPVPDSAAHTVPSKAGTIFTCAQPQLLQLCCIPSSPRHPRGAEERTEKVLVQQIHKSFHLMIIYELDQKLITVVLKKEFLAAEQLA